MEQPDLLYNIMMQLPLNDIKTLCMTMTKANTICHTQHFWYEKMIKDDILIGTTSNLQRYELLINFKEKIIHDMATDKLDLPSSLPFDLLPEKLKAKIPYTEYVFNLKIKPMMNRYVVSCYVDDVNYGIVMSYHEVIHYLVYLYDAKYHNDQLYMTQKDYENVYNEYNEYSDDDEL